MNDFCGDFHNWMRVSGKAIYYERIHNLLCDLSFVDYAIGNTSRRDEFAFWSFNVHIPYMGSSSLMHNLGEGIHVNANGGHANVVCTHLNSASCLVRIA